MTAPIDAPTWYADADNDGYGGLETIILMQCDQPNQYTSIDDAIDCNDLNADANPFAVKHVLMAWTMTVMVSLMA